MADPATPIPLFAGYGIELEYMIVDCERLSVLPVCDRVLQSVAGETVNEYENGTIAWSNELVLHVIELKTNGPAAGYAGLPAAFQASIEQINDILQEFEGQLMPTAMHPWMDPDRETRLWPHEASEIYDSYNRIFDCRGHGWSNLQSTHINLPFADEREFADLHAAIRVLLPVMPALAASSPVMAGEFTGLMDSRLETYRHNADRIPSITGMVIPEPVDSFAGYQEMILQPMYDDIAPEDPERVLQHEWLNSRGAITRFDRQTIEIRLLDIQEMPAADLAIAALLTAILKKLLAGRWSARNEQNRANTAILAEVLLDCIRDGEQAVVRNRSYLQLFGFPDRNCQARELWQYLLETVSIDDPDLDPGLRETVNYIIHNGSLARRIRLALGKQARPATLRETWRQLCRCLAEGRRFEGI